MSHRLPSQPSSQSHTPEVALQAPCRHMPHCGSEQSAPVKPGAHSQRRPSTHSPWPSSLWQSLGHSDTEQSLRVPLPTKPGSQMHLPSSHWPWPEQSLGQRGLPQAAPIQSSSQRHWNSSPSLSHSPWPEQGLDVSSRRGQPRTEQSSPYHGLSQRQRDAPFSSPSTSSHTPCSPQSFGHVSCPQPAPMKPGAHRQRSRPHSPLPAAALQLLGHCSAVALHA
mmetsp:Transcript_29705/g.97159  ORF Transcript_29705/g.97159 Transcript_29705/m.97159 type:complete len:222 (-) Transcript_29705:2221-2886(-)